MKNQFCLLLSFVLWMSATSCMQISQKDKPVYVGHFEEKKYDFFESVGHIVDTNYYYKVPFEIKFAGLVDSGEGRYEWLRNPVHLAMAFNTAKSIGLDQFISKRQYFEKNNDWCCENDWDNKSLHDVINGFIQSDTLKSEDKYYRAFWNRRRKEKNLTTVYHIFQEIDLFYQGKEKSSTVQPIDPLMRSLLEYDLSLSHADSIAYKKIALNYFNYLKQSGLNYSAYKFVLHNNRLDFTTRFKDSLLHTIKHDTISQKDWEWTDDNANGWIRGNDYNDPQRSYGP